MDIFGRRSRVASTEDAKEFSVPENREGEEVTIELDDAEQINLRILLLQLVIAASTPGDIISSILFAARVFEEYVLGE